MNAETSVKNFNRHFEKASNPYIFAFLCYTVIQKPRGKSYFGMKSLAMMTSLISAYNPHYEQYGTVSIRYISDSLMTVYGTI